MLTEADIELIHNFDIEPEELTLELYKTLETSKEQLKKQSALIKQDMLDIKELLKVHNRDLLQYYLNIVFIINTS